MDNKSSEKRFALLIDADNVSAKYIKPVTDELSNYGTVTIKRIYGDWTLTLHAKWKDALLENSLTPIQQFGYTQGKNATDSAMIIDAMDILYTGSVDGFCIVSSDSDFTRLASRLRESGKMVIGMGEKKTPTPFRRACDVFTTLDLLLDDAKGRKGKGDASSGPSIEEVEQAVVRIITDNQNNGKATGLGEVGSRLLKRFPDFDVRSYGTNLLSKLLGKFNSVQITKSGSDVTVELADERAAATETPAAESAEADRPSEETQSSSSSRRRRRGRRRSEGKAVAALPPGQTTQIEALPAGSPAEDGVEHDAPEVGEASEEAETQAEPSSHAGSSEKAQVKDEHSTDAQAQAKPSARTSAKTRSRRKGHGRAASPEVAQPAADEAAQPVEEETAAPAALAGHAVDATTRRLVGEAGANGIEVSRLAQQVRAAHRGFKVRERGFAQFKQYVASLDDIQMERIGKEWYARLAD